jgi:hypothetical protein
LSLAGANLEHADLGMLRGLEDLRWLSLAANLPAHGRVPSLPRLELLFMNTRSVTDEHLPAREDFPSLRVLALGCSQITSKGLGKLADSEFGLEYLDIFRCDGLNETCIPHVLRFRSLKCLCLGYRFQGNSLAAALPKCELVWALPSDVGPCRDYSRSSNK